MNEGLIPHRYAKALLKFAIEKGADKHLYELMNRLQDAFRQFPDLDASMSNPFIDSAKKVQLLLTAAGAQPTDEVYSDFLKLLRNNNRLSMARAIAIAYADAYRKMNHIYQVEVSAAAPLDKDSEERLKKLILRHLDGGTMEYSFRLDPSLIGGFAVKVGFERLDASVKNDLNRIRQKLLG